MVICRSSIQSACEGLTGKEKARQAIHFVLQQHQRLEQKKTTQDLEHREKVLLVLKVDHFKNKRLDSREQRIDGQTKNKRKNAAQRKNGIDRTDQIAGRVKFSLAARKAKLLLVDQELDFREIDRTATNKKGLLVEATITEKVKRLRIHEAAITKTKMSELTTFVPLSTSVEDFYKEVSSLVVNE
jgi:hypothetical protein